MTTATQIRDASHRNHVASGKAQSQKTRYMQALVKARDEGIELRGVILRDLTDKEAAAVIGCDRGSINARRDDLAGKRAPKAAQDDPPVVESKARLCTVTGHSAMAWRAR